MNTERWTEGRDLPGSLVAVATAIARGERGPTALPISYASSPPVQIREPRRCCLVLARARTRTKRGVGRKAIRRGRAQPHACTGEGPHGGAILSRRKLLSWHRYVELPCGGLLVAREERRERKEERNELGFGEGRPAGGVLFLRKSRMAVRSN